MSLYIGKNTAGGNIIHFTSAESDKLTMSSIMNIKGNTVFNSSLGFYEVINTQTEVIANTIPNYGTPVNGLHILSSSLTGNAILYPYSSNIFKIVLIYINGILYDLSELYTIININLGLVASMTDSSYSLDGWGFANAPIINSASSVILTLKKTVFPVGAININNNDITIGGVSIRDKQLLVRSVLNSVDTSYSTVTSNYSILNSISKTTYPNTILTESGIFAYSNNTSNKIPIILSNAFMNANVTVDYTINDLQTASVNIPNPDSRIVHAVVSLNGFIGTGFWLSDAVPPNSVVNCVLDGTRKEYSLGISYGADSSERTYAASLICFPDYSIKIGFGWSTQLSGCSTAFNQAISCFHLPLLTHDELYNNRCGGLNIFQLFYGVSDSPDFPATLPNGAGGSNPFLHITKVEYSYVSV